MAALLVGISVMTLMLSIALPTWSHMVRREKEEELIFRGNQYARAIALYQRTRANAFPTSVDQLIEQRLLRKKYKDPLSPNENGEFQLIFQSQLQAAGARGTGASSTRGTGAGGSTSTGGAAAVGTPLSTFQSSSGPIVGVVSKNTGTAIRTYKGKQKYSEWQFTSMEMSNQAGAGGVGGSGRGGGRGGDGRGADGRGGTPPFGGRSGDRSTTTPGGGTTFTPLRGQPR